MINFDEVDFSERRCEEVIFSFFWRFSVVLVDKNECFFLKGSILTPDIRNQPQTSLDSL